jgi:hypothetical protein
MKRTRQIVAVVGVVASIALAPAAAHATSPDPLANPTSNTAPGNAFSAACSGMGTTKADNDRCDTAALVDFNAVRASEGLGPMTLPHQFDTLTVPLQLLAISDIERVDRGLVPVVGLSSTIDALAQQGADADDDPQFPDPFHGSSGGSNWAGAGNSVLLDDFYWMYDDGLGSPNGDCTQGDQSGCWGHRDDIIGNGYVAPVLMGAAVTYQTAEGTSMAEEFIGGDTSDSADVTPTWATISASTPVSLSSTSARVSVDTRARGHATIVVTAPAGGARVQASVTSGSSAWTVSPRSCSLAASGDTCALHLTFNPPSSGAHNGSLLVVGPAQDQRVSLVGRQAPPRVAISPGPSHVAPHHIVTIAGVVTAGVAHTAVAHQLVALERRHGSHWSKLAVSHSSAPGVVHFRLRPAATATYRLEALSASGIAEAPSASRRIRVL